MKERIKLIRVTDTSLGRLCEGACPKLPKLEAQRLMGGTNPYAVAWVSPEETAAAEKKAADAKAKVAARKKVAKPPKVVKPAAESKR